MRMTIRVTVKGSNQQQNTISIKNMRGEYFSHFDTIGVNPFRGFDVFEGGNNNNPLLGNNNNNNPPPLPLSGFGRGLEEGFNPLSSENPEELDPNVVALVNALIGANLGINYVERESNHIKLTKFRETEAKDPNEWLE